MKLNRLALVIAAGLAVTGCGSDKESDSNIDVVVTPGLAEAADPTIAGDVTFTNVGVHDPSVVRTEDGTYYVFGSHLAAAKTTDLMNWTLISSLSSNSAVDESPLFATYTSEIADGIAWTDGYTGSWASDVIQSPSGSYWFYYSHCAQTEADGGCWNRSYLGVATSDNIEGPYVNQGVFLRSGYRAGELDTYPVDGVTAYDASVHPNVIDPAAFYDADGNMWLVYGSYSGGIFVLALDEETGLPEDGQGYGTHIAGGNYGAMEGAFVIYSPETEYYYLFTSVGGFNQNDGYNMRVSRSRNPNGPYLDSAGQDMVNATSTNDIIDEYGVKLMGSHVFTSDTGDATASHGYMSPGHNSAFYDEDTGKYLLFFHTRFPSTGEAHEVRVHEMFMNEDGWLVASPQRYAPIDGDNLVDIDDLAGYYKVINHGHDTNTEPKYSEYLSLNTRGQISGDYTGTFTVSDDKYITLNIDDLGTFDGVMAWQWDSYAGELVPTFSAIDEEGASFWGSKLDDMSTQEGLALVRDNISLSDEITTDLILPTEGTRGASISWSSSDTTVIRNDGQVNRPGSGDDVTITMTATISLNGQSITKSFDVVVKARVAYNRVADYSFDDTLEDGLAMQSSATTINNLTDRTATELGYATGVDGNAIWLDGSAGVLLPDGLINSYEYTVSFWMNAESLAIFTPAFFGAVSDTDWLSLLPWCWDGNIMAWSNHEGAWFDGITGQPAAADTWYHMAFAVKAGAAKVYINGEEYFSGGNFADIFTGNDATFTLGLNYWDAPFKGLIDELRIYESQLSAAEVKALDVESATDEEMLAIAVEELSLGDISAIREDIFLPNSGAFAANINWTTSNSTYITTDGTVAQPTKAEGDQTVTLTASISLNGLSASKTFDATVKFKGIPTPIAAFTFDNSDLTDDKGNFDAGTVTGSLIGTTGGSVSYADGASGMALVLDGASGVQLPNNLITDNSYSISLWLNPEALTQYTTSFFGYASDSSWISVLPYGNDAVGGNTMLWSGTAWYDAGAGEQIEIGVWNNLIITVNDGAAAIYLNGNQVYSGTAFPDIFSGTGSKGFSLGVNYWDTPYKGMIDDLYIFDDVLTASDALEFYQTSIASE